MKLLCVKVEKKGLFFKGSWKNLTLGKKYAGFPVGPVGLFNDSASIERIRFLVFNDLDQWELYPLECFVPEVSRVLSAREFPNEW